MYLWNIALSESLYGPIHHAEVTFRNALYQQMLNKHGANWFDSLTLAPHMDLMLNEAKDSLAREGKPITDPRLVAELNFGFWLSLLAKRFETSLWIPCLRHALPARPRHILRNDVYQSLNKIRLLRNRIAHHEPIFERRLADDYGGILELVGWICADTARWIDQNNRFRQVIGNRP
ncbi:MAG: hypothetical protein K2X77_20290 [Candidatus Obscuribacterales bacterium]|nr:hypothetical protein [Candidatus Obscuribacterales bacterium]